MDVGSESGTVKVSGTTATSYPAIFTYDDGSEVHLEAVPVDGYFFKNWSGDLSGNTNLTTIVIDCNKKITANFSRIMHTLTIQLDGSGSITPAEGTYHYGEGEIVSIAAAPDSGWQFDGWSGDVIDPSTAVTSLTMDSDKTIVANFSAIMTISWPLVGGVIGGLVLVGLPILILISKRRAH